jgi:hypothetical protein
MQADMIDCASADQEAGDRYRAVAYENSLQRNNTAVIFEHKGQRPGTKYLYHS